MTQRSYDEILKENLELRNMLTVMRDKYKECFDERESYRTALELIGSCTDERIKKYPRLPGPRSSKVVPIRPTNGSAP